MATRKAYASRTTETSEPQITRRRIAAVVAAAGGWYTTWLFITAVGIIGIPGFAVAVIVEWLLFEFKREVLADKQQLTVGGVVAIAIDTVMNGGGMWGVVLGLNNTDTYKMLYASMQSQATATAATEAITNPSSMPMLVYLVISLVLGFILAIAPHKLWR